MMLFAAVAMLAAGSAPAATAASGPMQLWKKADEYAANRLYIDAVNTYTQTIRTNKGEIGIDEIARVFSGRALAYQGLKEYDKAVDDFGNAIRLDEKNPEHYQNRAAVYALMDDQARAIEDLTKAIELSPRTMAAYLQRGAAYLAAGNRDGAVKDYAMVLEFEPKNRMALYNIGLAYRLKGQTDKALEAFNKVLELDPKHPNAPYQEAAIFSRQGKIDSACIWLETAAENGFQDWAAVKNDPDFDKLRDVGCYRKVLSGK
jgi:tetratricopeptide (TPR) repeat protein